MSANPTMPEWFQTEWDDMVIHKYQDGGGRVAPTVRSKTVTDAKDMIFRSIGQIAWAEIDNKGKRKRTGADRQKITLTPKPSGALLEVKERDVNRMSVDDRAAMMKEARNAMYRYRDDEIVTEMATMAVNTSIGGAGEFASPQLLHEVWEILNAQGIYAGEVELTLLGSPRFFSQIGRFDEWKSTDYSAVSQPNQTQRGVKNFMDLDMIRFDRLPKAGDLHSFFVYAKPAVCHGTLQEERTIWSWENDEDCWLGNMAMETGAQTLIENGLYHFQIDGSITGREIDPDTYAVIT